VTVLPMTRIVVLPLGMDVIHTMFPARIPSVEAVKDLLLRLVFRSVGVEPFVVGRRGRQGFSARWASRSARNSISIRTDDTRFRREEVSSLSSVLGEVVNSGVGFTIDLVVISPSARPFLLEGGVVGGVVERRAALEADGGSRSSYNRIRVSEISVRNPKGLAVSFDREIVRLHLSVNELRGAWFVYAVHGAIHSYHGEYCSAVFHVFWFSYVPVVQVKEVLRVPFQFVDAGEVDCSVLFYTNIGGADLRK
jgi:hypothetical protein